MERAKALRARREELIAAEIAASGARAAFEQPVTSGQSLREEEATFTGRHGLVSKEVEARLAIIEACDREDTDTCLGEVEKKREIHSASTSELQRELNHFDAIFSASLGSSHKAVAAPEPPTKKRPPTPTEDDSPLWKRLKLGDEVDARGSSDGYWYPCLITQVTHGGFPSAKYTVQFTGDGKKESKSVRDLRPRQRLATPEPDAQNKAATADPGPGEVPVSLNPLAAQRASAAQGGWRAKARGR